MARRAVGYARVSSESQAEGYSLDAQRGQIKAYGERMGHELITIYVEEGVSAHGEHIESRPQLAALLDAAKRGEFDLVVVHTLDRWARNVGVQRQALYILGQAGVGFASISENVDFTTPLGKLTLTMLGGISEFFSDQLGVHVAKGQREKVAQGGRIGPIPFGYLLLEPGGIAVLDERAAPAVREAFQRRAAGASNGEIAMWLNASGHRTKRGRLFTAHGVKDMLNCCFYIGRVTYRGEEFPGLHEPLVPPSLFEQVQSRRQHREGGRRPRDEGIWAARGLLYCHRCGRPVHCERHDGKAYYRERHSFECPTVGSAVSGKRLDAEIGEWFGRLRVDRRWRERILRAASGDERAVSAVSLRDQRKRLVRAYADGGFEEAEYMTRLAQIDARIEAAQPDRIPRLEVVAELLADTRRLWARALPHERRQLIAPLVDRITVCMEAKRLIEVVPTPALAQLLSTDRS